MDEIRRDFKRWQARHPNFMTPNVLGIKTKGDKDIIEISSGRGIDNENIFGVTHIKRTSTGNWETKEGEMFRDRHSAEVYAKKLKQVI